MDFEKTVSIITKTGAVALTTVGSFLIKPPVIDPEIQVVNWHNVFVVLAGIIGIILASKSESSQTKNNGKIGLSLIIGIVFLVGAYELMYYKFSRECFNEVRVIVGAEDKILPSALPDYSKWKDEPDPIKSFVEAYQCEPQSIWPITWLLIPYWAILVLYLAISALVTFSISFTSSLIISNKEK